jgi:two-component system, NtrC family, C4-dicarboxylate transport response regulator DctD
MSEKKLVLIIEDNEDFQDLYGMIAEQAGYTVEKIVDGKTALARLERESTPTLILLDSRLPGAEGEVILEAARSKEAWQNVPIYMLTADTRLTKKYAEIPAGEPRPDGVIEKGAEAIQNLRELFTKYN